MKQKNWYQSNKRWFLPTIITGSVVFFLCIVLLIMLLVTNSMKSSGAYKLSLKLIKSNSECIEKLGEPINDGFFITGQIQTASNSGNANFTISLEGSKSKGTAYSVCEKKAGKWEIIDLDVVIDNDKIDIK